MTWLIVLAAVVFTSVVFTVALGSTTTLVALFWRWVKDNHWIETKDERDAWKIRPLQEFYLYAKMDPIIYGNFFFRKMRYLYPYLTRIDPLSLRLGRYLYKHKQEVEREQKRQAGTKGDPAAEQGDHGE